MPVTLEEVKDSVGILFQLREDLDHAFKGS